MLLYLLTRLHGEPPDDFVADDLETVLAAELRRQCDGRLPLLAVTAEQRGADLYVRMRLPAPDGGDVPVDETWGPVAARCEDVAVFLDQTAEGLGLPWRYRVQPY